MYTGMYAIKIYYRMTSTLKIMYIRMTGGECNTFESMAKCNAEVIIPDQRK